MRGLRAITTAARENTRTVLVRATFNDDVILTGDNIIDVKIKEGLCPSSGLTMGATVSASITMRLKMPENPLLLTGGYVDIECGFLYNDVNRYTYIGRYYITDVKSKDNNVVEITGFDGFSKMEKPYVPTISMPNTADQILSDIAAQCGIEYEVDMIPSGTFDYYDFTCRQWVGYFAGLVGCNAIFNSLGYLTFRWFSGANSTYYNIDRTQQHLNGLERTTSDILQVESITSGTKENVIVSGTGSGFSFENPFMTQEILDEIYSYTFPEEFNYMPCKLKWRGDPRVEPGDIMHVETSLGAYENMLVMEQTLNISGGLSSEIICYGKSEERISFQTSPTAQKIQQVYTKLQEAISAATELLNGSNGGIFEITDGNNDGINDGWIIHSADGQKFIKANINGIGITQDGGATYTEAMTPAGINASAVTTGAMNAQRISVGDASLGDVFTVGTDENNHIVVKIGSSASDIHQEQTNDAINFVSSENTNLAEFSPTGARWADMQEMAYCGFVWTKSAVSGNVRFTIAGSDK